MYDADDPGTSLRRDVGALGPAGVWAWRVVCAFREHNYVRFHRLARHAPSWLLAALAFLALPQVRLDAIPIIAQAYTGKEAARRRLGALLSPGPLSFVGQPRAPGRSCRWTR